MSTLDLLGGRKLILASKSPRRKELLSLLNVNFTVAENFDCEEDYPKNLAVEQIPIFLSLLKSKAYPYPLFEDSILLTADTIVISEGMVFGKPATRHKAIEMLKLLSGKTHIVVTGITLRDVDKAVSFSETSKVSFRDMSQGEIEYYVDNFNPIDKAGAYGIQDWIGAAAVSSIEGSYYNIVGLPTEKLYVELRKFVDGH